MSRLTCERLSAWLCQEESGALPSEDLVAHIADCPHCRGTLAFLLAALLHIPLAKAGLGSCYACEADLAAYVDFERTQGESAAVLAFPHVWLHLWVCVDCTETYCLIGALAAAEATGAAEPQQLKLG